MRIALGSLGETQNHLRAALNDKLITGGRLRQRLVTLGTSDQGVKEATLVSSQLPQPQLI